MAISIAEVDKGNSPEVLPSGRAFELVKVTGATGIAGDTATYTTKFITEPEGVVGAFSFAVSNQTVTLKSLSALGNDFTHALIFGKYGRI